MKQQEAMMRNGIRIVRATPSPVSSSGGYDYTHSYMYGYEIDLRRRTAVLLRQSKRGADELNPESRLRQEGLVRVAVEIRADHDSTAVVECDEGSGVSGQKKIYERPKLMHLWEGIQNHTIGSVIVAREDRLFRDRFLTQATQFAEECAKRGVILIIAGRRCYDFRIQDDFNAFIRKMQESYGYIDTHVRYMNQMKQQKQARGEWVGGGLVAPYVLDRQAIAVAREQRRAIKEFGSSEEDEQFIARAFRPIIYEPWHPIAVDLFEKFKLFGFSRARLGRHIEERKYIFPLPIAEDTQRYLFKVSMRLVPGRGYTITGPTQLAKWLCNLMHLGYASIGKDEDGNRIYIEGAFDAAIPRDLFEPCYESITGFTLDGKPSTMPSNRSRFIRKRSSYEKSDLLTRLFTSPDTSLAFQASYEKTETNTRCYLCYLKRSGDGDEEKRVTQWGNLVLWRLPVAAFDRSVVGRLAALAEHDKELANRVEKYYKELTANKASEKAAILQEISRLEALIARYDHLLTKPARPLTEFQEKRYLQDQADAEIDLDKARAALLRYERTQPEQFIPAFYRILGEAPGEFWDLDVDQQRRMLSLLIDEIQVENISPHLYKLLLKWKDPVAERWDCALIYKRQAVRTNLLSTIDRQWTDEEDRLIRELWPEADKFDIYKAIPTKSGASIKARAGDLGVRRAEHLWHPSKGCIMNQALCYNDWVSACAALEEDITREEGRTVLEQLNYLARTTSRKARAAFWWVLPVAEMNDLNGDLTRRA
jgi:DNA invertase Pin-like site-specific DNA recombinase